MITDKGKEIIGKYLLGQAPAYASYIAIGCGAQPLQTSDPYNQYGEYDEKENLDFEMFRVPISSRGFVNEGGTEKIVLTAELPTEERYEISEVGLYSAGSNPSAGAFDSKTVFAFTQGENWQYHTSTAASIIPLITEPLDTPLNDNVIATTSAVFQSNADNSIFYKTPRPERYERCRFFNNIILIRGDTSDITVDPSTGSTAGDFIIEPGSNHIHLTDPNIDFDRNSLEDELRLAFSIINKDGSTDTPDTVRIMIVFAETDVENSGEYASFEIELDDSEYDFATNRYYVETKKLGELNQTSGFTWNAVTVVKIYACILVSDNPSNEYYIALDALRLENTQTVNPLYGLTGYSVVRNEEAVTIVKSPNTSNYIEFRFAIEVT